MLEALYNLKVHRLDNTETTLQTYQNKVLLIVNTASQCGFTPQYAALEALYQRYCEQGFVILGFPCNQFGGQEPGDSAKIADFCTNHFHISFPMFAKIDVNGKHTHPLYALLKSNAKGLLGTEAIKWNFTKFLVNRQGDVVARYAPTTKPNDLIFAIERLL